MRHLIGHEDGVNALELIEAWVDYLGKPGHGECRMCELAAWLNGFDAFNVHPQPHQGDGDGKLFRGQPVVWDGSWSCVDGQLWYEGSDGPSGGNGPARRAIVNEDRVMFL
jgi:hypothetical protein